MPTFFNINNRKGVFMIPAGATKSPTPSFTNTKSLAFDGVDEYMDSGDVLGFDYTEAFTFSAWIKYTQTVASNTIIGKQETSGNFRGYDWFVTSDHKLRLFLYHTGSNRLDQKGTTVLADDTWYHIAVSYDGSGSYLGVKMYIDGNLETLTRLGNTSITGTTLNSIPFQVGARGNGSDVFIGNIDELSVYNTALSDADISTIATAPSDLSTYNPVAWYRMGDNSTYQTPQILMPENTNKDKVSNWSLEFDGVDDYIGIGTTSLGITSAISVSAWVKTTDILPLFKVIVCEDVTSSGQRNWLLVQNSSRKVQFVVWHTDGSFTSITRVTIDEINDGNWHHVMATFDGTTNANGLKLYVDGNVESATAVSTGINSTAIVEPYIGSLTNGNAWRWNGNIDEVSVFDAVKVEADVSDGTEPIDLTGKANLVAYWKLGEEATFSTNWTVPDSSANSNDGTSANMTIEDRVGDAPNSENNAVSYNMEAIDIDNDTP